MWVFVLLQFPSHTTYSDVKDETLTFGVENVKGFAEGRIISRDKDAEEFGRLRGSFRHIVVIITSIGDDSIC
jgi:hypothetical protein